MVHSSTRKEKIELFYFFLGILSIFIFWFVTSLINNNIIYPTVETVFVDLFNLLKERYTYQLILYTLLRLSIVIILSYLISYIIAYFSLKYIRFRSFITPIISFMRSIPIASIIVILILIVGTKYSPIIITLFMIIPIAQENLYVSFKSIDNDIIEETKMIANIDFKIYLKLFTPIIIPYIISSLLTSFGLGLKVLVMSEVLTQGSDTIGGQIQLARTLIDTKRVFSWTILLIVFVLIFDLIIKKVNKHFDYQKTS